MSAILLHWLVLFSTSRLCSNSLVQFPCAADVSKIALRAIGQIAMRSSMYPLPEPSSGLFLEVSFRRLLTSCEEIIAGDSKGRQDFSAANWKTSPVFHHVRNLLVFNLEIPLQQDPRTFECYQRSMLGRCESN